MLLVFILLFNVWLQFNMTPNSDIMGVTTYFHLVNDTGLVWGMRQFLLHGTAYLFDLHQYQNIQS